MPKAIKQLLVAAAVIAISMVFIIQFQPGASIEDINVQGSRCAVEVGGDCVPYSDYVSAYRLASPGGRIDEDRLEEMRLDQVVVDGLIERYVLLKEAERLGITASGEEVSRQIATTGSVRFSLPVDKEALYPMMLNQASGGGMLPPPYGPARMVDIVDPKTRKFSYERYQEWVQRRSGKTEQDFKAYQQKEFVAARVRQMVRSQVHVSESEARLKYSRNNEKVVVDYVALPREYYQRYAIDTSDETVQKWIEEHGEEVDAAWAEQKDDYLPSCREARHILVRIDDTVPDKAQAKEAAKAAAQKAKDRIEGGESFADVAKDVSQDLNSASEGGKLGCFAKGKLQAPATDPKIDETAHGLEEGQISEPVETRLGFHIVQVDKVADAEEAEALGRAVVGRDLYLEQESERLAAEGAKAILTAVKGGKSLQDAIDQHLTSVLLSDAKAAYETGRAAAKAAAPKDDDGAEEDEDEDEEGAEEDAADPTDAWNDPIRPQPDVSAPFTQRMPAFAQIEDPAGTGRILHELKKPGEVPDDVIKMVEGYAVASLKERKPVTDEDWADKREAEIERALRQKQSDVLIAYVQRLKQEHAQEVILHVGAKKNETAPAPSATATGSGS